MVQFRFWTCSIHDCSKSASIDTGSCERCQKHFCVTHVDSALHPCDKASLDDAAWEQAQTEELESLGRSINYESLLRRASLLRGGIACHIDDTDPLGRSRLGGMHVHRRIIFADGLAWLARIPRQNFTSFSDDITNSTLLSECATLQWLARIRGVPSPSLHGYGLRNDQQNDVGVAYMLIDELPGRPLLYLDPSPEQMKKVSQDLARILYALSEHPFDKIGSLSFDSAGEICVGPIVGDRTGTLPPLGPFSNAIDYYVKWAEAYLSLTSDHQLFSSYAPNSYLIFKYFGKLASDGRLNQFEECLDDGPFFLKHMDDKGDHILVDDDFNIVGLIDWTFARTVPVYEAFGPSLVTADMQSIYMGKPGLSNRDRMLEQSLISVNTKLSRYAGAPDLARRLTFGLGMGMNLTWQEALDVFKGVVATFEGHIDGFGWDKWRTEHITHFGADRNLDDLEQYHRDNAGQGSTNAQTSDVPRFATCSIQNCGRSAVRGASCSMCKQHLCTMHRSHSFHSCPSMSQISDEAWEKSINDEVAGLLAKINVGELTKRGTLLNEGKSCKFQAGKHIGSGSLMGCANYHGILVFNDGEEWLVRIPRTGFSDVLMELAEYLVVSEYATLKFLESTALPTPKAFGYGLASDITNLVGVNYILIQKLPGKPYYRRMASTEQKRHVLKQVAGHSIELSKYSLPKAGSLLMEDKQITVGPVASNRFVSLGKYGPFDSAFDYFTSIAEQHLDLIADGQIYDKYPKEAFLFYKFLHRHVYDLCVNESPAAFHLKHVDDKGDHLLVDDNYNVTGIIDWQFARTVPACEAFGPSIMTADLRALYSGQAGLSDDDKFFAEELRLRGRQDLAAYACGRESVRRFHFGLASGLNREEACNMIKGMLASFGKEIQDIDSWMEEEIEKSRKNDRWIKVEALLSSSS